MVKLSRPGWRLAAASTALAAGLVTLPSDPAAAAPAAAAATTKVVAKNLNNPRHLQWHDGGLYVAEAGTGGDGPCIPAPEGEACVGSSGSITRVRSGAQRRVVTGLPSLAGEEGARAIGPSDVRVRGHRYTVALGLGANPQLRAKLGPEGRRLATVSTGRLGRAGLRVLADVAAFEALNNPDGELDGKQPVLDTNPVGLLSRGKKTYVVDAGGDALLRYRRNHDVSAAAVFADVPDVPVPAPAGGGTTSMDAVPTAAAYGPDGAIYVSQLTGFPFPVGGASIWRVVPGKAPAKYATGLTNVTDLAFGKNGVLYAVQLTNTGLLNPGPGSVVRIPAGGGARHAVVADGLNQPYGIALHGESAYVTTCATCAGTGEVVRIPLRRS